MMEKVLVLGASGLVGRALIDEFKDEFEVYGTYFSNATSLPDDKQFQLEVQQIEKMKEIIQTVQPDLVISCLRGAFAQQLDFHKALANELQNYPSRLYYFSTTNVFDGDFSRPHLESDLPIADSAYGKFKIECEQLLKERLNERVMIIRIPAIWGVNSLRWNTIKESEQNHTKIEVYSNLICNNLLDVQLAKQLRYIVDYKLTGIFHLGSMDEMTQGEFYEQLLNRLGIDNQILQSQLFQETSDPRYFTLVSNRSELPDTLKSTNEEIMAYLLG